VTAHPHKPGKPVSYQQWIIQTYHASFYTVGYKSTWLSASAVQRSGDAQGDCLIVCPLTNFSVEQWLMVVIVMVYTLFVTSGGSKVGPGWAMVPQIFAWPPV